MACSFFHLTNNLDIPLNSITSSSVMLTFDHLIQATQASLLFLKCSSLNTIRLLEQLIDSIVLILL